MSETMPAPYEPKVGDRVRYRYGGHTGTVTRRVHRMYGDWLIQWDGAKELEAWAENLEPIATPDAAASALNGRA